jgi:hypothetical protein
LNQCIWALYGTFVVVAYSVNVVGSEVYGLILRPLLCLCIAVSCPLLSGLAKVLRSVVFSVVFIVKLSDGRWFYLCPEI